MESFPHIETLHNVSWMPWVILLLGFCLLLTEWTNNGYLMGCLRMLLAAPERMYEEMPKILPIIFSFVFHVGAFALALYVGLYRGGDFRMMPFMAILLVVVGLLGCREVIVTFVGYVFGFLPDLGTIRAHVRSLWTMLAIFLLVDVLLTMCFPVLVGRMWLLMGTIVAYWLLLFWKMLRGYMRNILSLFYIFLYLFTVEVLPIGGVIWITQQWALNL